ncbi:fungal specific transcription factor, partial [Colletotrichum asianum]
QDTPTEQFSNPPAVVESQGFDPPAKVWEHQNGFLLPRSTGQDENIRPGSSHVSDTRFVRAISLSALVHPSHEANVSPLSRGPSPINGGFFVRLAETQSVLMQVCESLGLSVESLQLLTNLYFENMTAFSLFHQPSFGDKIQAIPNTLHLSALMSSMFSISARFAADEALPLAEAQCSSPHAYFHGLARKLIDQAIDECDDDPPPLCVLQALILCTFYELTRGVRGRAWRMVGTCVRVAYELRLHLVDSMAPTTPPSTTTELDQWSTMEERRRSWWAIWEMDVFASTVRRCPTAIGQDLNETYLPVPDDMWFKNTYQPSCLLDPNPTERSRKLALSGNDSSAAWFITINSIMRNAQVLAQGNLHSILSDLAPGDDFHSLKRYFHGSFRRRQSAEDTRQLSMLLKALQQTVADLPQRLAYKGTQLGFGSSTPSFASNKTQAVSDKKLDAAQHSIFLATQLARFMIYHHYAFSEVLLGTIFSESGSSSPSLGWTATPRDPKERLSHSEGLRNCLKASDDIYAIICRSSDTHVKWTSPFLASTVWLAASLQILRKVFASSICDEMSEQKIILLRKTYQSYTDVWDTPQSLLQNLDSLEQRLMRKKSEMAAMEAQHSANFTSSEWTHQSAWMSSHEDICSSSADQGIMGLNMLSMSSQDDPRMSASSQDGNIDHLAFANAPYGSLQTPNLNTSDGFNGFSEADQELSFFISSLIG